MPGYHPGMHRLVAALLLLTFVTPAVARRPPRVGDALCVSWSGPPLLALAPAARDAYLAALSAAGWRLVRTDFTWKDIEPTPGRLEFTAYDDLVARAAAHDIQLLGILDYGNPWAAVGVPANDDRYPPDDPATFARFAGATARHFRGRVPAWEIWNEPNFAVFWKPGPEPARYATLATAAAATIRRADRKATIVTGGLAPTIDFFTFGQDWGFLAAVLQTAPRFLRAFDAVALHPYTFLQAPAPEIDAANVGPSLPHQIDHFRAVVRTGRGRRPPLWVTELGWHTAPDSGAPGFPPGVSELDQARYLVRGTTLALAAGVERVCWYTATDYTNFQHDKEAAFGVFRYDAASTGPPDPKPAFTAAATLGRVLGTTRFVRDLRRELRLPDDAYALCFRDRSRHTTVIVFWATREGVAVRAGIGSGVRGLTRVELDGTTTSLGRPRAVDLTVGQSPFYLVLDERR